ncbi:LADA_0B07470g1_1 [Lachancea dasiensis]|uniref:LADA_0B07470g1_1 n=1 Tax=Lachancea dasiensis TaxID=1072105 RepID=A0A1G4IU47_9SACH|nr:LADA_0B07470g1_1 [Lachancea dasiensis]
MQRCIAPLRANTVSLPLVSLGQTFEELVIECHKGEKTPACSHRTPPASPTPLATILDIEKEGFPSKGLSGLLGRSRGDNEFGVMQKVLDRKSEESQGLLRSSSALTFKEYTCGRRLIHAVRHELEGSQKLNGITRPLSEPKGGTLVPSNSCIKEREKTPGCFRESCSLHPHARDQTHISSRDNNATNVDDRLASPMEETQVYVDQNGSDSCLSSTSTSASQSSNSRQTTVEIVEPASHSVSNSACGLAISDDRPNETCKDDRLAGIFQEGVPYSGECTDRKSFNSAVGPLPDYVDPSTLSDSTSHSDHVPGRLSSVHKPLKDLIYQTNHKLYRVDSHKVCHKAGLSKKWPTELPHLHRRFKDDKKKVNPTPP